MAYCDDCGAKIKADDGFCPDCGKKVSKTKKQDTVWVRAKKKHHFIRNFFIVIGVIFFLFILIGIIGYNTSQNTINMKQQPYKSKNGYYENFEYQFSIEYPYDWDYKENPGMGVVIAFISPEQDEFIENFNIASQKLEQPITLEEYVELSEEQLAEVIPNYHLVTTGGFSSGDLKYKVLEFTSNQGGQQLKQAQYYMIEGDFAYIITYTALEKTYYIHLKTINNIVQSFKPLNKEQPQKQITTTTTTAKTDCQKLYQEYVDVYNKYTEKINQGLGNSPEAVEAYDYFKEVKADYEKCVANLK